MKLTHGGWPDLGIVIGTYDPSGPVRHGQM
jgi:hypothetical protein